MGDKMRNKLPHTAEMPALPACIDMDAVHPYEPHDEIRDAVLSWWEAQQELDLIDAQLEHMRTKARELHAKRIALKSKQNEVAEVSPQARELLDACRCVNVGDLHGSFAFFEGYARLHVHRCWQLDPE